MTGAAFILRDGNLVPAPPETTGGLAHGYGIFETLRAYDGWLFELAAHLERMRYGADCLRVKTPPFTEVEAGCRLALESTGPRDARVRLTCVAAEGGSRLWTTTDLMPSEFIIQVEPVDPSLADIRRDGVAIIISSHRVHRGSIVAGVKTIGYAGHILAKREAVEAGAYDALILNNHNEVVEGTMSNVFIIKDGRIATPALECGPLAGVTRSNVMRLARKAGLDLEEGRFGTEAVAGADECFLTSSVAEIVPVVTFGGKPIGSGEPGGTTRRLQEDYAELTRG